MNENDTSPSTEGKVNKNNDLRDKDLVLICGTQPYMIVTQGEKSSMAIEEGSTVTQDPNVLIESQPLDIALGKVPISQVAREEMKKKELETIKEKMRKFEYVDKQSMRMLGMSDEEMDKYIKAQQSKQEEAKTVAEK